MAKFHQGRFRPVNPGKYKGDPSNIIYRSSWELKLLRYLDKHPDIVWYSSEEVAIPYRSPIDGKMHRYFPDFIVRKKNKDGTTNTVMIEVKPKAQTKAPNPAKKNATKTGRVSPRYLNEVKTYGINMAKWAAARDYCEDRGWLFTIFTEDHLGVKR